MNRPRDTDFLGEIPRNGLLTSMVSRGMPWAETHTRTKGEDPQLRESPLARRESPFKASALQRHSLWPNGPSRQSDNRDFWEPEASPFLYRPLQEGLKRSLRPEEKAGLKRSLWPKEKAGLKRGLWPDVKAGLKRGLKPEEKAGLKRGLWPTENAGLKRSLWTEEQNQDADLLKLAP